MIGQAVRHQDAERTLQQVVVERAQKLGNEQGREAACRHEPYECGVHGFVSCIQSRYTIVTAAQAAVTSRSHIEPSSKGSRPYAANVTGCSTTPKMRAVAKSGP